jgi:hypothetical protein
MSRATSATTPTNASMNSIYTEPTDNTQVKNGWAKIKAYVSSVLHILGSELISYTEAAAEARARRGLGVRE